MAKVLKGEKEMAKNKNDDKLPLCSICGAPVPPYNDVRVLKRTMGIFPPCESAHLYAVEGCCGNEKYQGLIAARPKFQRTYSEIWRLNTPE